MKEYHLLEERRAFKIAKQILFHGHYLEAPAVKKACSGPSEVAVGDPWGIFTSA